MHVHVPNYQLKRLNTHRHTVTYVRTIMYTSQWFPLIRPPYLQALVATVERWPLPTGRSKCVYSLHCISGKNMATLEKVVTVESGD